MAILTYERMDKRTKAHNANGNDLHGGWGAYWYAFGTYIGRYTRHFKRFSVDKPQQTDHGELGFACENYYRHMVSSVKAYLFNMDSRFQAYFIDMDYRKQTNNLIYGK